MKHPVRVLIVDDQVSTRQGLQALFALTPGVQVVGEAGNGREAIELVADRHPDVVVMDVQMPVMDGLEATRQIKSKWPKVRVVALSMYAEYQQQVLAAGADESLLKGSPTEVLLSAVVGTRDPEDDGNSVPPP